MNTILEIFKAYNGTGYYCMLFIICLIYLWFVEEDKRIRVLLVYAPTVIQVLFFIPYFYMIYDKLDSGTYYRILWLLPMSAVIAYAGCKVIGVHTKIGLAVLAAILLMSGTFVYKSQYMTATENAYHIPQEAIVVCDMIKPKEGEERVWVVVPNDLVHFVRQYSTNIQLAFGREQLVSDWIGDDENPLYSMYKQDEIELQQLSDYATDYYCHYVVLEHEKVLTGGEAQDYDLMKIGETANYDVYRNLRVDFWEK